MQQRGGRYTRRPDGRLEVAEAATAPSDAADERRRQVPAATREQASAGTRGPTRDSPAPEESDDSGARAAAVKAAVAAVRERGAPAELTADGRPSVQAVEAELGGQVAAWERDAAWESITSEEEA